MAAFLMAAACAAAGAEPPSSTVAIRSAGDFYNMSEAERLQRHPLSIELLVNFYDPAWKLLWGENNGRGVYLVTRGVPLPLKAGQWVRIEGTVIPAAGISGEEVRVTVLAEGSANAPIPSAGRLEDISRLDAQWTTTDGYVLQQQEIDPEHIIVEVLSEGRVIHARLLVSGSDPVPQLVGARVRINYVYVATVDSSGQLRSIDGWIPRRSDIQLLSWIDDDPRWKLPITPIDRVVAGVPDEWVHVRGEIRSRAAGAITIRDATGQLVVRTEQTLNPKLGEYVDVVGRPNGSNLDASLRHPVCRVVRGDPTAPGSHRGSVRSARNR